MAETRAALTTPPNFALEGLWQALGRLDRMLERATAAADAAASGTSELEPYRGLYITAEDVRRLVRRGPGEPWLAAGEPAATNGTSMPEGSRFPWLKQAFDLEPIDVDIVLIALAPEVDLRYERLYAYLHDDVTRRRPTVDLALNLLCATREAKIVARDRFAPDAPLLRHKLLQLAPDGLVPPAPLLAQYMKLEEPIVRFLLGRASLDARLQSVARFTSEVEAPGGPRSDPLEPIVTRALAAGERPHLYLQGPAGASKDAAVAQLAATLRLPLLAASARHLGGAKGDFESTLDLLLREAQLHGAIVYLTEFDAVLGTEDAAAAEAVRTALDATPRIVVAAGERPCGARFRTMTSISMAAPGFADRRAAWASALKAEGIDLDDRGVDELASRQPLDDAQIKEAAASAGRDAKVKGNRPDLAQLTRTAQLQLTRDPGALARKVRPFYAWKDLVLPAEQIGLLKDICRHARYRHIVYDEWGFDRKVSLGKGLSALFTGPPGTGKTMAVEVIANDLGLEIYKIDLSQVVSKYIGETEKSIDKLFALARDSNAILFFDECDALFGKRTVVHDAHDRYANIEVAYLLQKLDDHEGLTILATNLRQNLDAAFTRRLTFIVEFPFPDEDSRRRMWASIWPSAVPRSKDLDLEFMATQFKVPGGGVKNIAVAAAFLAAEHREELKTEHLLLAARREIEKSGRRVPRSEFGPYAARVDALGARDDP